MKSFRSIVLAVGVLAAMTAEADAFVCGAGPYRAGCVGPRGGFVAPRYGYGWRPYGYARPYWRRPYY